MASGAGPGVMLDPPSVVGKATAICPMPGKPRSMAVLAKTIVPGGLTNWRNVSNDSVKELTASEKLIVGVVISSWPGVMGVISLPEKPVVGVEVVGAGVTVEPGDDGTVDLVLGEVIVVVFGAVGVVTVVVLLWDPIPGVEAPTSALSVA